MGGGWQSKYVINGWREGGRGHRNLLKALMSLSRISEEEWQSNVSAKLIKKLNMYILFNINA